jgi:Holliday junction resolvase RusA-like endonuclease
MIEFEIDGEPISWKRPAHRSFRSNNKNVIVVYDKQKHDKEMVRWQIKGQFKEEMLSVPLLIDLTFRMPIPKATTKKVREQMRQGEMHHMRRPDIDNLSKFYLDCMNELVFADDAQIWTLYARKVYSSYPSTLIRIRPYTKNIYQDELDKIEELEEDEHNSRESRRRELHRSNSDEKRIDLFGGQKDSHQPVRDE